MLENDIKHKFTDDWHSVLQKTLGLDKLRLYAIELPVFTLDGDKRADLVYEVEVGKSHDNPMFIIELKKDKIDVGVCEQVSRYSHYIQKQLYRTKQVKSIIAAPDFSDWELKLCKEQGIYALQFDLKGNMRLI